MNFGVLIGAAELGLVFGITALGVYVTYRILDFPDMTVDGSITLGAAVAAVAVRRGSSPWLGLALAPLAGALAGIITGLLHAGLHITPLLAGILTMTGLYSVNLRVMGRANLSLLGEPTICQGLGTLGVASRYQWVCCGMLAAILAVASLRWFLGTEIGLGLRATGDNATMAESQGVNVGTMRVLGLGLGNALVALSGALAAALQGYADMGMGVGTIVAGLAAVIIGETLWRSDTVPRALIAVVSGSLTYRLIISLALRMGLRATDLRLVTAGLVVAALSAPRLGFGRKNIMRGRRQDAAARGSSESME